MDYNKVDNSSKNKNINSSSSSGMKIPRVHNEFADSSTSDHIVIISQLTEKYASLEKQLQIKENQLIEKDKYVCIENYCPIIRFGCIFIFKV